MLILLKSFKMPVKSELKVDLKSNERTQVKIRYKTDFQLTFLPSPLSAVIKAALIIYCYVTNYLKHSVSPWCTFIFS
jgi:hypothetical protein